MSERVRLSGNLRLVCVADAVRGTSIAEQAFAAPLHLSKAYWDGGTLLVNVVNQTAGIFGGDGVTMQVEVQAGARVLLSSPTAALFHPSHGRESRIEQTFVVRDGASLDVLPSLAIPQRDSRSVQRTTIDVEPGGELIYLESLAPGRVASGEAFAFTRYSWATDVRVGNRLVHRERAMIEPPVHGLAGFRALFPASYGASLVLISPLAENWPSDFAQDMAEISKENSHVTASKLSAHGWSVRILSRDSIALHKSIGRARALIFERLGRKAPDARRCGS